MLYNKKEASRKCYKCREILYAIEIKRVLKNILHINGKITVVIHITKSRCDNLVISTIKGLDIILSGQT